MNNTMISLQPPMKPLHGTCFMLMVTFLFAVMNRMLPEGRPWNWNNILISWTHAFFVAIWTVVCMITSPEILDDLIGHYTMSSYLMVAFSTGYFLYDLLDIVVNNKSKQFWEVILHHVTVGGMFYYNIYNSTCIAFTVVALTTEINTVFLHTRKLMQMWGLPYEHRLYRLNNLVNLATFIVFRFGALWVIGYGLLHWRHLVSSVYYAMMFGSWAIMSVINVVLFWRLVKNDIIRPMSVKCKSLS